MCCIQPFFCRCSTCGRRVLHQHRRKQSNRPFWESPLWAGGTIPELSPARRPPMSRGERGRQETRPNWRPRQASGGRRINSERSGSGNPRWVSRCDGPGVARQRPASGDGDGAGEGDVQCSMGKHRCAERKANRGDRRNINPWEWSKEFGFSQAVELAGADRLVSCPGQTVVASGRSPGSLPEGADMSTQVRKGVRELEYVLVRGFGDGRRGSNQLLDDRCPDKLITVLGPLASEFLRR